MAGTLVALAACSPDDYGFGDAQYSADDLKAPDAYTVTVNGNKVDLQSKIYGCTPLWITPSGQSQESALTLELPFAGDYEVTFGAETRSGVVYGEPYKFTLAQNDFSLLSDDKWFLLSDDNFYTGDELPDAETLTQGVSKKWYPCDKDYGLGCTGPLMYMAPYNPTNQEGAFTPEEKANLVYKPVPFGRANWAPNWDPGIQSWLISEDNPYMDSYMIFSMDAANGCVATMYRGESGSKGQSTGTEMTGKFQLGLVDKLHPTISFTDCYAMHNLGFDGVCANYTQDIILAELTPYYMALITKRTNSEGNWYLVWNFVSEEVRNTNGACIPAEESQLLQKSDPVLPEITDLATALFTVENNGVTYIGNQVTYTVNTDAPYDWTWWNGAAAVNAWQNLTNGEYNNTWAPMPGDNVYDNELVISRDSKGAYTYTYGENEGSVTLGENTLTFSQSLKFFAVSNDYRTVAVEGKTFTVLRAAAGEGITLGVPSSANENGITDSYLVVNLDTKPIGAAQTGPTVVELTSDYTGHTWIENNCLRLAFHHYGDGGTGIFKDASKVKLKKEQTIKVTFTLKSGLNWTKAPKCALIDNNIKQTWEPGCFDLDDAATVNLAGETTVTLKNTTGATQKFTSTCLDLSVQLDGCYGGEYGGDVTPDIFEKVTCVIE